MPDSWQKQKTGRANGQAGKLQGGGARRERRRMANDQVTRKQLIDLLNEDLAREYQAIIAYVNYSQALKGAEYMSIAKELEKHAGEELKHALIVSKHIDYLGGKPNATAKPVKLSEKATDMLRFD